jgi:hypothetical protein
LSFLDRAGDGTPADALEDAAIRNRGGSAMA